MPGFHQPVRRYAPQGALASFENGGGTQLTETYDYNNRLQVVRLQLAPYQTSNDLVCWVYNYYGNVANPTACSIPAQGTGDDGDVVGQYEKDTVNTSLTHTVGLTYDPTHRLTSSVATGNATHNLTFSYDRYGNMTCQTNGQTQGPCPNYAFSASTNRISTSGFTYDATGDLTSDGTHSYQYECREPTARISRATHSAICQVVLTPTDYFCPCDRKCRDWGCRTSSSAPAR
jgi:YD repeat-containing protein